MKRILLLETGGIITCKRTDKGLKPVTTSDEILSYASDSQSYCEVHSIQLMNIDSINIQPCYWLAVEKAIKKNHSQYNSFIVTHGVNIMACMAAVLSYLTQHSPKSIIITGIQKPIDMENMNAKTNLADNFFFVFCPDAHGVNVVFGSKVVAGTRGKKEWIKSYHAFSSINFPCVAIIQGGQIIFYLDDKDRDKEPVYFYRWMDGDMGLMKLIPSMDASLLDYMAEHYDTVIVESFGVGDLPPYQDGDYHDAIARWAGLGKAVIMTTQVTNEGNDMSVYEVGRNIKREFDLLEAYDVALEAVVTKIM